MVCVGGSRCLARTTSHPQTRPSYYHLLLLPLGAHPVHGLRESLCLDLHQQIFLHNLLAGLVRGRWRRDRARRLLSFIPIAQGERMGGL